MAYPDRLLAEGEEVIWHLRPHASTLVGPAAVFVLVAGAASYGAAALAAPAGRGLVLLAALLVALRWSLLPVLRRQGTHVVLTDRRLLLREGVLTHVGRDLSLDRIGEVSFESTLGDRMLGRGTLLIQTEDGEDRQDGEADPDDEADEDGGGGVVLRHLPDIAAVHRDLYELTEAAATRSAPA